MNKYIPDGWCLIKKDKEIYVFGSWSGGYTQPDRWRRNSGIHSVEEDSCNYYFIGYSGSEYVCSKKHNHISMNNYGVLESMLAHKGISKVSEEHIKDNYTVIKRK